MKKFLCILCFLAGSLFAKENIRGVIDIAVKNDYITQRGLLVTNTGLSVQVLNAFELDVCKAGTLHFGIWNNLWTNQDDPNVGVWNELDWFVGWSIGFQDQWKFHAQFVELVSPPHNFIPENNAEFTLSYEDAFSINPYIRLWWAISGDSTVVVGKRGGTYYVELGLIPEYTFNAVRFTFPIWLSVGPPNFWNGGEDALRHNRCNFGLFSTGIHMRAPIGNWYFSVGGQYYYLINDNLLQAQLFTVGVPSLGAAYRNVGVASLSLGFDF